MHPLQALAVAAAGVLAGTINTVVGSGTLVSFPVLLAVGYPPLIANVSNGLGLVPGSLFGAIGYRRELVGQGARVRRLGLASALGGVGGAFLLLTLPPAAFSTVVPVLIALALVLVVFQPRLARRLAARRAPNGTATTGTPADGTPADGTTTSAAAPAVRDARWLWLAILATGVYGGYFGAAQGVIALGVMGVALAEPLQRVNAVKNVLAMTANLTSGIVFVFVAHVAWLAVLLIAVGSALGGIIGAKIGRRLPPVALRGLIVVIGIVAIGKLVLT